MSLPCVVVTWRECKVVFSFIDFVVLLSDGLCKRVSVSECDFCANGEGDPLLSSPLAYQSISFATCANSSPALVCIGLI